MPADWRFVVASSGVHADKAGTVRDRHNRASQAVERLLSIWNSTSESPAHSLAAALDSAPDAEERLRRNSRDESAASSQFSSDDLERRLSMFVRETARVPLAAAAFCALPIEIASNR